MRDFSKELQKEYEMRFTGLADYRNSVWKILIEHYFQKIIGSDQTILDLGAGWGEFINNVQAKKKFAMDLNEESSSKISSEVTFLHQDCSQGWNLADNSLDVIFTSNFFEHLRDKPSLDSTLDQAFRCLKPKGKLICLGPNIKYIGNDYWDYYDHCLPLSHLSLVESLRMRNYQISSVTPRFLPYTMVDGKQHSLNCVKLYLKFPIAWRLFGKQFLVIGTKAPE